MAVVMAQNTWWSILFCYRFLRGHSYFWWVVYFWCTSKDRLNPDNVGLYQRRVYMGGEGWVEMGWRPGCGWRWKAWLWEMASVLFELVPEVGCFCFLAVYKMRIVLLQLTVETSVLPCQTNHLLERKNQCQVCHKAKLDLCGGNELSQTNTLLP